MPRQEDYTEAGVHGVLWTPQAVLPSVRWWLDAGRPDTVTLNSGRVSDWADLSGRGYTASQATSGLQPLWNGAGQGITFASSRNDALVTASNLWAGSPSFLAEVAVVTLVSVSALTNGITFCLTDPNAGARVQTHLPYSDGVVYWDAGGTGAERVSAAWGGTLGQPHVWTFMSSNSQARQYASRDGTTVASDASGANLYNGTVAYLGGNTGSGNTTDCTYYEFLFLDNAADWLVRKAEGYLAWKWGRQAFLAAGHPYRNAPPLIGG